MSDQLLRDWEKHLKTLRWGVSTEQGTIRAMFTMKRDAIMFAWNWLWQNPELDRVQLVEFLSGRGVDVWRDDFDPTKTEKHWAFR